MSLPTLPPGTPEFHLYTVGYKTHTAGYLSVMRGKVQLARVCSIELPWRDNLNGVSCVPADSYEIVLEWSPAFKMHLWELKGVPGRSETKIHAVNFVKDLRGCIGPGEAFKDLDKDGVYDLVSSKKALSTIHAAMGSTKRSLIHITSGNNQRVLLPGMNGA